MAGLIWCPFPDEAAARAAIDMLLAEGLVACGNILGEMQSIFMWRGERGEARETGVLLKTDAALLGAAIARLEAIHPYDTPAILGWPCDSAGAVTRTWLGELVREGRP